MWNFIQFLSVFWIWMQSITDIVKMQLCDRENILKGRYFFLFFSCSMVHNSPLYIWLFQTKALRNYLIIWSYCIIYFDNSMPCMTQYCCFDVHFISPTKNSKQILSIWNYIGIKIVPNILMWNKYKRSQYLIQNQMHRLRIISKMWSVKKQFPSIGNILNKLQKCL